MECINIYEAVCILLALFALEKTPNKSKLMHRILVFKVIKDV